MSGNFYSLLRERFSSYLEKPFLSLPDGRSYSYGEMDALSEQMAGAIAECGAKPGDRMLVQVEKSSENIALYLGALRAGVVYTPLNTAYTQDELSYFLRDAEPVIFVCDPARKVELTHVANTAGVETLLTLGRDGSGSLMKAAAAANPIKHITTRHRDDLAVILYTSGTTGRSKGAMLSHDNLASNALALNNLWEFTQEDVLLHALPVFHIHGLFVALHTAMLSACELLFLPQFSVPDIRKTLPRATMMMGVPTFYTRLLGDNSFNETSCAHMRLFISGSAPLTIEAFDAFKERTGCAILERYGMSEAGMIASNPLAGERVAGSVGFALPDVEIRITDDKGDPAPIGVSGNVEISGPNVFKGYWRNPDKTREAFAEDGFFLTGDIGALDEQGRLTLAGRSKDMIIAGGYNIYPKEIEQILDAIPGVTESAVIGAPHADMGEGVVAALVGDENQADREILDEAVASLARFKRPRRFYWLDALPRNAMGKVQKQILREQFKNAFLPDTPC